MAVLKQSPDDFIVEEILSLTPKESGLYLLVKVTKRGRNTEEVAQLLARECRLPSKAVAYAGTKDRHAVTTQFFSLRGVKREAVERISLEGITLEPIGYLDEPLALGLLDGNRFMITLRDLSGDESLLLPGQVPNYFDEQRFSTANAAIGEALVRKEFKGACELLIKHDRQHGIMIGLHLDKAKSDYVGALTLLPYRLLKLLLHAYQSRLWNELLATYIKKNSSSPRSSSYSQGELLFPGNGEEVKNILLPLPGFGNEVKDSSIGTMLRDLLKKERLSERDFVIRQLTNLSLEGGDRDAFMRVSEYAISPFEDDDFFPSKKKATLTFTLGKGSYATMLVKALFA